MNTIIQLTLGLLVGLNSNISYSKTFNFNPDRTVKIIGVIDGTALQIAERIEQLSAASDDTIDILINSPGGSILFGNFIIQAIKQAKKRGVVVNCVSGTLAASMAFQLFVHCDSNYAFRTTQLLFHPPRIMTNSPLLKEDLLRMAIGLDGVEKQLVPELREMLQLPSSTFKEHYYLETLWNAEDLLAISGNPWIEIIDDVTGVSGIYTISRPRFGFFGIQWISPVDLH